MAVHVPKPPPPDPAQAPSFADLPPDILHHIFGALLPSSQSLPLLDAAQQCLALQLTCKAWAAALQHVTVAVQACLAPPGSVHWLQEHVAVLHLLVPDWSRYEHPAGSSDYSGMEPWMLDWITRRCGTGGSERSNMGRGFDAYLSFSYQCWAYMPLLMEGATHAPLAGIGNLRAAAGSPLLALAACRNLQVCARRAPF